MLESESQGAVEGTEKESPWSVASSKAEGVLRVASSNTMFLWSRFSWEVARGAGLEPYYLATRQVEGVLWSVFAINFAIHWQQSRITDRIVSMFNQSAKRIQNLWGRVSKHSSNWATVVRADMVSVTVWQPKMVVALAARRRRKVWLLNCDSNLNQ